MRKLAYVYVLAAASLAGCATANPPADRASVGKVRILVGDPSAIQPMPASRSVGQFADNPSPEPKRVYWYLAGR